MKILKKKRKEKKWKKFEGKERKNILMTLSLKNKNWIEIFIEFFFKGRKLKDQETIRIFFVKN